MKWISLFLLTACGLFQPRPNHPDVMKYQLAGHWERSNMYYTSYEGKKVRSFHSWLNISCWGGIDLKDESYKGSIRLFTLEELKSDIDKITDDEISVHLFTDIKWTPPKCHKGKCVLILDGNKWVRVQKFDCEKKASSEEEA